MISQTNHWTLLPKLKWPWRQKQNTFVKNESAARSVISDILPTKRIWGFLGFLLRRTTGGLWGASESEGAGPGGSGGGPRSGPCLLTMRARTLLTKD